MTAILIVVSFVFFVFSIFNDVLRKNVVDFIFIDSSILDDECEEKDVLESFLRSLPQ